MFGFSIVKSPFSFTDIKTITIPTINMFWFRFIPEMFSTLSAAFCVVRLSFVFLLVWLLIISLFIRFRELKLANFNGNGNECDGCVSVRYNSLFISVFAAVYKSSQNNYVK